MQVLRDAIEACRVTKSPYEIALLRHANGITTAAHTAVLRSLKSKENERELEAVFIERCIALGAPKQAYHGIFGSGTDAATLHYVHNDKPLEEKLNILVDAAAEYNCYCADVTRTIPLSGKFTPESRAIYEIVNEMQSECLGMMKAGVLWEDVHKRAHEVAIEGLLHLGILKGARKTEIYGRGTSVAFFPHGLGHYLGMDTHDVGGKPNYKDKDKMFRYLRVRGILPKDSVITVEPGVYFCRFIIEPYLEDEEHKGLIDEGVLERYWDVGGVRIEGELPILANGGLREEVADFECRRYSDYGKWVREPDDSTEDDQGDGENHQQLANHRLVLLSSDQLDLFKRAWYHGYSSLLCLQPFSIHSAPNPTIGDVCLPRGLNIAIQIWDK